MIETEREFMALTCIAAACADGHLGTDERRRIRRLTDDLGLGDQDLFRRALASPVDITQVGRHVRGMEARRHTYQMAVLVCQADGVLTPPEEEFLTRLQSALELSDAAARGIRTEAAAYADPGLPPTAPASGSQGDLDERILRYAILAGAAELLPQSVASVIVLPLQLKLVYEVGQRHAVALDRGQVLELASAFGIGATSQVVESFARRLFGGVARQVGGRLFGAVGEAATGALLSFSTTYALGHAADRYYARGRSLSEDDLKELFRRFRDDAKTIYPRVEAEIRAQADRLDTKALFAKVRDLA